MICCGLFEVDDAAMTCFRGGLNREIQDILDYKEYACKAEREVQGRRSRTYTNSFAGRSSASSSAPAKPAPSPPTTTTREKTSTPAAPPPTGAAPSTGRTWDI